MTALIDKIRILTNFLQVLLQVKGKLTGSAKNVKKAKLTL